MTLHINFAGFKYSLKYNYGRVTTNLRMAHLIALIIQVTCGLPDLIGKF